MSNLCPNCRCRSGLNMEYLYDDDIEYEWWWCSYCDWDEARNHRVIE